VDIEYQKLISHSVTRWLSLYPNLDLRACFSVMAHYPNVERFFSWCSRKPKKREIVL